MSYLNAFTEPSITLLLKAKQLRKLLAHDDTALYFADRLYDSAMYLHACVNEAVSAETESRAVEALRLAYTRVGSSAYYVALLKETRYLSDSAVNSFLSDLDRIKRSLEPIIDKYGDRFE